jgi:hypothetical protein
MFVGFVFSVSLRLHSCFVSMPCVFVAGSRLFTPAFDILSVRLGSSDSASIRHITLRRRARLLRYNLQLVNFPTDLFFVFGFLYKPCHTYLPRSPWCFPLGASVYLLIGGLDHNIVTDNRVCFFDLPFFFGFRFDAKPTRLRLLRLRFRTLHSFDFFSLIGFLLIFLRDIPPLEFLFLGHGPSYTVIGVRIFGS